MNTSVSLARLIVEWTLKMFGSHRATKQPERREQAHCADHYRRHLESAFVAIGHNSGPKRRRASQSGQSSDLSPGRARSDTLRCSRSAQIAVNRVDLAVSEVREIAPGAVRHQSELTPARSFAGAQQMAEVFERIGLRHGPNRWRHHPNPLSWVRSSS